MQKGLNMFGTGEGIHGCERGGTRRLMLSVGLMVAAVMMVTGCTSRFYHSPSASASNQPRMAETEAAQASEAPRPEREADVAFRGASSNARTPASPPRLAQVDGPDSALIRLGTFGQLEQMDRNGAEGVDVRLGNLKRITYAQEGADFDPVVSPDGEHLVFASTRHRQTEDLYMKRVDGATITQLTDDPARDVMPAFSPDGSRIAFASDRTGRWDIYMIDAGGGQAMQVTNDRHHNIHPSFSPDGKRLVYSSYSRSAGQWQMVVVSLDRPGTRHFIGPGLFPKWVPATSDQSDRILFQRARDRGSRWFSVWTLPLDEAGEAGSPTEIVASTNAAVITPAWSPDGDHIVFCTVSDPGADDQQGAGVSGESGRASRTEADVWVVRADGTGQARLTRGGFANLQPTWASDGTIYFTSNRGGEGVENIWALRPDEALRLASPESDAPGSSAAAR